MGARVHKTYIFRVVARFLEQLEARDPLKHHFPRQLQHFHLQQHLFFGLCPSFAALALTLTLTLSLILNLTLTLTRCSP